MKNCSLLWALLLCVSGSLFAQAPTGKRILVEKITSVGCPGCPWGGYILDSLTRNDPEVIPVAVHVHDVWHVDQMAFPDGDSILAVYKWGHPTLMVDRVKFPGQGNVALLSSAWQSKIQERKLDPLEVTLGAQSVYDSTTRNLSVTLYGTVVNSLAGDLRLNAYVVESPVIGYGLGYDQLNGFNNQAGNPLYGLGDPIVGYEHKWVSRALLGGPWGVSGALPNPAPAGTAFNHAFSTALDTAWNQSNCYLVVLVQRWNNDSNERTILNALQLDLNESVLATLPEPGGGEEPQVRLYPNPFRGQATVQLSSAGESYRVFDLSGKLLREGEIAGPVFKLEQRDLQAGIYFLEVWEKDQPVHREKFMVAP